MKAPSSPQTLSTTAPLASQLTVSNNNTINNPKDPVKVFQSVAGDVKIREVHDWELDVLTKGDQSETKTIAYTCLGLTGGFAQNIYSLVSDFHNGVPITTFELVFSSIFLITTSVGVCCYFFSRSNASQAFQKKEEIRSIPLSQRS